MTIKLDISEQSIANPLEYTGKVNEDFIFNHLSGGIHRFVLCDGAGGQGVFCKEWAEFLAKSIPDSPDQFIDGFDSWYQRISHEFYSFILQSKDLSDPVLQSKFYKQGSLSTLLTLWIDTSDSKISFAGIGDSFLFHFQRGKFWELSSVFPVNDLNGIDDFPALVTWGVDAVESPSFHIQALLSDSIFILASDSLAKWLILLIDILDPLLLEKVGVSKSYRESLGTEKYRIKKEKMVIESQAKDISGLLHNLKEIAKTETSFRASMQELLQLGFVDQDDFSLVIIETYVS
jgi:hypothetical protein